MSNNFIVWIDHKEAHVVPVHKDGTGNVVVAAPLHRIRKHPHAAEEPKEHPADAKRYFHEVSRALEGAGAVLLVGPSTAKLEFVRYLHHSDKALEKKLVGVETADHPTDGQLIAHAKQYFEHHA